MFQNLSIIRLNGIQKALASAHKQNFMISANNRQVSAFPAFFQKMTVYKRLLGVYKRF